MKEALDEEFKKKVEEDSSMLKHLVNSMSDTESKFEEFYQKKDVDNFNKTKRFILQLNKRITDALK